MKFSALSLSLLLLCPFSLQAGWRDFYASFTHHFKSIFSYHYVQNQKDVRNKKAAQALEEIFPEEYLQYRKNKQKVNEKPDIFKNDNESNNSLVNNIKAAKFDSSFYTNTSQLNSIFMMSEISYLLNALKAQQELGKKGSVVNTIPKHLLENKIFDTENNALVINKNESILVKLPSKKLKISNEKVQYFLTFEGGISGKGLREITIALIKKKIINSGSVQKIQEVQEVSIVGTEIKDQEFDWKRARLINEKTKEVQYDGHWAPSSPNLIKHSTPENRA